LRDNRNFRTLYAANAVSQLGDWFNVVALFSLLLELTGKGEAVAFALLTRFVPMFLAGPAAGVVADRLSRRAIMIVSDVLRAGLVLCLLFIRRPEQAWIAYAVVAAHSLVSAFFEPAQQAMLPNLVTEADYPLAATLENSLWAATLAVGSALGGVALAVVGRNLAFAADAASFLVSAALIARLPTGFANRADRQALEMVEEARAPGSQIENLLGVRDLREGVAYVRSHRRVRALLAVKASFGLTLGGVLVLLAWFGEKVFAQGNGAGIAVLWTARGVGSFAGPFAAFLLAICYVGFALSPAIGFAAVALALANAGGSILWTSGSTLLQRIVPDAVRGRVAAAEIGGFMLALSASTLATGLLLDHGVSPRALMAACGLIALVPLGYWGFAQRAFEVTGQGARG